MREIKFRAYDPETSQMYDVKSFSFEGRPAVTLEYGPVYKMLMDEVYLMQFTGMKDQNEQEIYEGDVFKIKHDYKWKKESYFEVIFSRSFGYILRNENGDWVPLKDKSNVNEVIGNIHENPELLD